MSLPGWILEVATPAGSGRVYGADGSHILEQALSLPLESGDIRDRLNQELEPSWERTGETTWRRHTADEQSSATEVITLFPPEAVHMPGFNPALVPQGSGTVLVSSLLLSPPAAGRGVTKPALFRGRWLRGILKRGG